MSITKRIEKVLEHYELSPSRFADEIGVQRSNISHILSERNKPSLDLVLKILKRYTDLNAEWLVTGKGKMQLDLFGYKPQVSADVPANPAPAAAPPSGPSEAVANIQKTEPTPAKAEKQQQIANAINAMTTPAPVVQPEPAQTPHLVQEEPQAKYIRTPPVTPVYKTPEESPIQTVAPQAANGNPNKRLKRIVFFYDDNTFEVFNP